MVPHKQRLTLIILAIAGCCGVRSELLADDPQRVAQLDFFETHIRPVLVDQCYSCHNTASKHEGGLAVDSREGLLTGGDSGPALIPGNPQESLLLQVLRHELSGYEMPKAAPRLSAETIANFEKWVQSGAVDPRDQPPSGEDLAKALSWENVLAKRKEWWSFQPLAQPAVPAVNAAEWCQGDVDRFILAALEGIKLAPGPDASAAVLVRRLFFVLNGLPPSPPELEHWQARLNVTDKAERNSAYAQLVDELISRPAFGEHWSRHWMDWIRYAESHGAELDPDIGEGWRYRDYLIRALNGDVPYDQLVREHVAGDLLEEPRLNAELRINESLIGPAHWRMVFHGFTPTDALDERVRFIDDEINVFSKAFLGLTVSCARCHNHKFDAISQADYYALFGVLGSCRPGRDIIDLPEVQQKNVPELTALKGEIRRELSQAWMDQINSQSASWFENRDPEKSILGLWSTLNRDVANGSSVADAWKTLTDRWNEYQRQVAEFDQQSHLHRWKFDASSKDNQWFKNGLNLQNPASAGEFTVALKDDQIVSRILPAGWYTNALSSKHPGRISSPAFPVNQDCQVWLRLCGEQGAIGRYVIQQYPMTGLIYPSSTPTPEWTWAKLDLSYWKGDEAHLEVATSRDAPVPTTKFDRSWFGIQEAVVTLPGVAPPASPYRDGIGLVFKEAEQHPIETVADLQRCYVNAVTAAIQAWQNGSTTDEQALLLNAFLQERLLPNTLSSFGNARELVEQYRKLESQIAVPQRVPGFDETVGTNQPLYVRGNHKQPGEVIPRRFLEAIDSTPYESQLSGRRQLAEDLLREDNPLTRRVIVNRVWHHLFSEGLVRTPDNFGKMGDQPTHPELLDWLAARFEHQGWSMKTMIRELVLSHTWQLDSTPSAESLQRDPENRYLSHAPLRRLDAESIRDAMLADSGRLDRKMFGPPVKGDSDRRSIYVAVRRNSLDPFLRVFDAPEPFSSAGRRDITNVPAQALTMMNDPNVLRSGTAWATSLLAATPEITDSQRLDKLWVTAFARTPSEEEARRAQNYRERMQQRYLELEQHRSALNDEHRRVSETLAQLKQTATERILPQAAVRPPKVDLQPVGSWDFEGDFRDSLGGAHGNPVGDASISSGGVVVGNGKYVVTEPLKLSIGEKTLEAWVQLDTLDQRAGGVITIMASEGGGFDSIVFGEQAPGEWLAGSEFFARTKSFQASQEKDAANEPVHLAITYHADGRITGYRNGVPYGKSYKSNGIREYPAGQAFLIFGLRHLPAAGNLSGRILKAQLYNRALTPQEVQLSYQAYPQLRSLNEQELQQVLTSDERQFYVAATERQKELKGQLDSLPQIDVDSRTAAWADLARSTMLMKEFLYLR